MLQVRPDRPLSLLLLALIRTLDRVASSMNIPWFIIGATARDILMEHVYALETTRATHDVDFAVAVSSWDVFAELKARLIATGEFLAGEAGHRLYFGAGDGAYPLDLVPFDGVERNGEIAWPPDGDFVMNIAGYADANSSALDVEIAIGLTVRIISLPAMTILKILAWNDRRERGKHAADVLLLLRHYHAAGQLDRLYEDESDLLVAVDYDIELAGAALLGRDARLAISDKPCGQVHDILAVERNADMFLALATRSSHTPPERAGLLLDAFLQALQPTPAQPSAS
jgi:predicted nucleotidyltransferase